MTTLTEADSPPRWPRVRKIAGLPLYLIGYGFGMAAATVLTLTMHD